METKKYRLTDETIQVDGHTLHRIEALTHFSDVYKGDKGGFVESEDNLSQKGDCWIYGTAKVYGNAMVYGNAEVYDTAEVCGNARVLGNASICGNAKIWGNASISDYVRVYDNARVSGNARVYGNAKICGDAKVKSDSDYIVFKNWWSSGRYFTWTRINNMWSVGCFYGTGEELIAKAYKDSELSGREYERVVKYVESILKDSRK